MLFLGIDPDTRAPGFAILRTTKDGPVLLEAGVIMHRGWMHWPDSLASKVIDHIAVGEEVRIIVESQFIGDRSFAGDIVDLARMAGVLMATQCVLRGHLPSLNVTTITPKPAEWKGSLQKSRHQVQIRKRLPKLAEIAAEREMSKNAVADMVDAAGLALWAIDGGVCLPKLTRPKHKPPNPLKAARQPVEFENADLGEES